MADEPKDAIIAEKGSLTISDDLKLYMQDELFLSANVRGWFYGYGVVSLFKTKMKKAGIEKPFSDPEILSLFEKWCANWARALKSADVDFRRFTVPLMDEPRTEHLPELISAAEILKKYGFQVSSNFATWSTVDDIRKFSPYLHTAIPWETMVTTRSTADEVKQILKQNCSLIMPYLCSITENFAPLQRYFRFRGIRTFMLGGDGIALWAVNSWRQNDYRSGDDKKSGGGFLIHHGDERGFVPTLRLEAFREAIEDLYYLKLAEKSSSPAVKALVTPEKLNEVMLKDDPAVTAAWHEELVRALAGDSHVRENDPR